MRDLVENLSAVIKDDFSDTFVGDIDSLRKEVEFENIQNVAKDYKLLYKPEESAVPRQRNSVNKGTATPSMDEPKILRVLKSEVWRCVIREIHNDGIRVFATDTMNEYSSRYFTIKREYFEKLSCEPFDMLEEGQQIDWVFKRVKYPKGQEVNKEELNVFKNLQILEWQLRLQVEKEMEELSFLFPNL